MRTGWQCPACNACYAPFVPECRRCCAPVTTGAGTGDPIVVPSVSSPVPICFHYDCEDTTVGKRCKACGCLVPTFIWSVLPSDGFSCGTVTYSGPVPIGRCGHGVPLGMSCSQCLSAQAS